MDRGPDPAADVPPPQVDRCQICGSLPTDTFEYDLNLVASAHDAVAGNLVIDHPER
jgi:hypothetical protein